MLGPECDALLNDTTIALLGTGVSCVWETDSTLAVMLGSSPSFTLDDVVMTLPDVLKDVDELSDPTAAQTVQVLAPSNPPPVVPVVTGATQVGVCDVMELDAGMSYGNAGRAFVYAWSITAELNPSLSVNFTAVYIYIYIYIYS